MNISNSLSISRIVLTIPVAIFLILHNYNIAVIIGIIAGITDFLDGFLARRLNQVSELGKILDPVADKVFIGIIAIVLVYTGIMPFWFLIAILSRDILILLGGIYFRKKTNFVLTSTFEGKATFTIIMLVTLGLILDMWQAYSYGLYLATAAMIFTFFQYLFRMLKELKQ